MNRFLRTAYTAAGALATQLTRVGLPGDGKLARSVAARRDLMAVYRQLPRDPARPLLWMHAPSVGEGLQAVPVLERLRERRPDVQQFYTHFSPSAERFAARAGADFSAYLPWDVREDVSAALDLLRPTALVFSKLDVWPVLVEEAARRGVRLGMISATLAESSTRRGRLAMALTRDAYAMLDAVGAIDADDAERLVALGVRESAISVTGDTRYDQVWARAQAARTVAPWLARFDAVPRATLVAGSTWPSDEAPLLQAWLDLVRPYGVVRTGNHRLIIAPHEPTPAHLAPIERWAAQHKLTLARLDAPDDAAADVVLVDRVGVLGELYALADVAYVGGGFHAAGLHSVVEPAAFGAPVLFGPRIGASRDAQILRRERGGRVVDDHGTIRGVLTYWLGREAAGISDRRAYGDRARALVERGLGAADATTQLVTSLLN